MTAAAKADMTAGPKLLTSPWIIKMPRFITDCCTHVSTEKEATSRTRCHRTAKLPRSARSWGDFAAA